MTEQSTNEKKTEQKITDQIKKEQKAESDMDCVLSKRYGAESTDKIRERAKKLLLFFGFLISSWFISSSEGLFSTYPFGIVLISAAWWQYIPVCLGAFIAYLFGDIGGGYLFAYLTIVAIRLVMMLSPMPAASRELEPIKECTDENTQGLLEDKAKKSQGIVDFILSAYNILRDARTLRKKEECKQRDTFCMLFASVGGFVAGLFLLISTEFSFYSLYGCIFMTLFCPVVAYLLSGCMRRGGDVSNLRLNVGIMTLLVLLIMSTKERLFFGMMLMPIIAIAGVLFASDRKGVAAGVTAGALIGFAFDLKYMPLFLICAITYCMLERIKKSAAIAGVCAAVVLYCYYLGGMDGVISMLTPMLFGVPAFLIAERLVDFIDPKIRKAQRGHNMYFAEAVIEKDKNMAVRGRVHALSDAFSSLSKTFYELSDVFHRPDALHLRDITDEGFSSVCRGCRNKEVCYGSYYNRILDSNAKITSSLHTKGYVKSEDVDGMANWCIRCDRVILKVNELCTRYTEELIKNQNVDAFASNYEDVNAVLLDAISSDDGEYECDTEAGDKIFEYLSNLGFELRGVVVCGRRCKRVTVRGVLMSEKVNGERAESICECVSNIVGEQMSGPIFEVSNDGTDMIFSSKPKYKVVCSYTRTAAFEGLVPVENTEKDGVLDKKEEVNPFLESANEKRDELCGDVVSAFITENSYFYSMICDGMGSGRDAALCAGICSSFAEKMLFAGNRADITLRMLNNFLRSENSDNGKECSVAIDLFELDLMRGVASFIKSGAVPTYILRREKVYKVSSRTMPIGIIKAPDIKISKLDIESGDVVVMMSDGCTQDEDCAWLTKLLCELGVSGAIPDENIEEFAESLRDKILYTAKTEAYEKNINDDISVGVIVVV